MINPRRACAARVMVVGSVCVSVKSHLTSGVFDLKILSHTQRDQNICGVFSETALLQRSSTAPLKAIHMVGHFTAESAHAHFSLMCIIVNTT